VSKITISAEKPIILSVGGSLIVPENGPDVQFLEALKEFIEGQIEKGRRFVIVTGGGKTARHYINAISEIGDIDPEDLDWIGIHATRLNGHLMRTIFRKYAHAVVIKDPTTIEKDWRGEVLIAAGWKPGWSTDYVATRIAGRIGSEIVINLSDISHVFSEDPKKNPQAIPLDSLDWETYRGMVGNNWHPGKSAPFDPVASKFAEEHNLQVAVADGKDFKNLENLIEGREFLGTILHN